MTEASASHPDLAAVRAEFPLLEELAYFQTGTYGLMPRCVLRQVTDIITRFETRAWAAREEISQSRQQARELLASRIGAAPDEVAFTRNATDGVNLVAAGIAWQPGDEIIISDQEHGAMNLPWRWAAQRNGAVLRRYHVEHDPAANLANVAALVTPRTRLIGTSWVTSSYGIRLPVAEICRLARERGILSLVDGAQAFGAFKVDVRAVGCDFFTSNGHKWLGGPKGAGFFWASADRLTGLLPSQVGAGGCVEQSDFDQPLCFVPNSRRFEFGTDHFHLQAALLPALLWFDTLGWDWVEARVRRLSTYFKEELARVPGVTVKTPFEWEQASGLTTFAVEGADHAALWAYLRTECRVLPVARAERIRVSTAYYNTEEEIDRLVEGVRHYLRTRGA